MVFSARPLELLLVVAETLQKLKRLEMKATANAVEAEKRSRFLELFLKERRRRKLRTKQWQEEAGR